MDMPTAQAEDLNLFVNVRHQFERLVGEMTVAQ